jgi:hypothetical protein
VLQIDLRLAISLAAGRALENARDVLPARRGGTAQDLVELA